jgi:hypothetical protein
MDNLNNRILVVFIISTIAIVNIKAQYQPIRFVYCSGASVLMGDNLILNSTLGQTNTGNAQSDIIILSSGFWSIIQNSIITNVDESIISDISFDLYQNYPNPFNPVTIIRYSIPDRSYVQLTIYNTIGQIITNLINEELEAGIHEATFDAANFPSGMYIYRLQAGEYVRSKKLLLMK